MNGCIKGWSNEYESWWDLASKSLQMRTRSSYMVCGATLDNSHQILNQFQLDESAWELMKIGSQSCALNSCLTVIDRCLYFYHLDTDDIMYSSVYIQSHLL